MRAPTRHSIATEVRGAAEKVGAMLAAVTDSRLQIAVIVVLFGTLVGALQYAVNENIIPLHTTGKTHSIVDAVFSGGGTAAVVLFLFIAIRERRRKILEEIRKVAELNHQIRNALQVIVDSKYLPESEQTELVLESVKKIDAALHQLFPSVGQRKTNRMHRRRVFS